MRISLQVRVKKAGGCAKVVTGCSSRPGVGMAVGDYAGMWGNNGAETGFTLDLGDFLHGRLRRGINL